jgi:hypothetical protein
MDDISRQNFLDDLLVEIDHAWHDPSARPRIEALIQQHPEWADEAREFLAALEGMDEPGEDELRQADDRIHQWLLSTGIEAALAKATRTAHETPTRSAHRPRAGDAGRGPQGAPKARESWLSFLGNKTGRKKAELARSLPHVTLEFLSLVSRYPTVVPESARLALSDLAQEHLGIPVNDSLCYLQHRDVVSARAASRKSERDRPPETFAQILERAALSAEDRRYWEECARGG